MSENTTLKSVPALDNMTPEDWGDLTDEGFDELVDLVCAHNGLSLLPPHYGEEPTKPEVKREIVSWSIGGWEFESKEDAEAVAELVNGKKVVKTDYVRGYRETAAVGWKRLEDVSPRKMEWGSVAEFARVEEDLNKYEERLAQWREAKELYNAAADERKMARDFVADRRREGLDYLSLERRIRRLFARYLELAEGDILTAHRFLVDKEGEEAVEFLEDEHQQEIRQRQPEAAPVLVTDGDA